MTDFDVGLEAVSIESIPEHNLDLEKSVLQTVILRPGNRSLYLGSLDESHFYDARHQVMWRIIQGINLECPTFDLALVSDAISRDGIDSKTCQVAGGSYLHLEVMQDQYFAVSANAPLHIRRLRELARQRLQREIGLRMASGLVQEDLPALLDALRAPVWQEEDALESSAEAVAREATADWDATMALVKAGKQFAGLDCGFDGINSRLNGLCPGELTLLAARPSLGKSTLALQMALHVARNDAKGVGIISLEMTRGQVGSKAACILADVDSECQRRGKLSPHEQGRYAQALNDLSRLPLQVWTQDRRIDAICARIRQGTQVDLWIVDHLHRIHGHGDTDHERYGSSTQALADLAVETGKHILLVSQLNRSCEARADKRPEISDLRGSGSIEEHAVNVLMIYRPGYYANLREQVKNDPAALAELISQAIIIAEKVRFGRVGVVELSWVPDRGTFANPAPTYRQGEAYLYDRRDPHPDR